MKILSFLLLSVLFACSSTDRKKTHTLYQEQAINRAQAIDKVAYQLSFELNKEDTFFVGTNSIFVQLDPSKLEDDLRIDFKKGEVRNLLVNEHPVDYTYNNEFITIPQEALKKGKNKIFISFKHPYSTTGSGLHRFVDPEDQRVYLYTDFEPYDSNELFPNFDQPDLKAKYEMQVKAPKDWTVVSSVLPKLVSDSGEYKLWHFPQSEIFSTYIFSLHAGPYKIWTDKRARIPSRLMARQSLAKYVDHQEWFKITRQGFDFFEKFFGYKYPYAKYDQLIVPEFNSGAMENVAAVTFTERYVHRSKPTLNERQRRANTILHEMAHMWFGNLVTMKWWNGLWLNESFATFMANLALHKATEFKDTWLTFFTETKQWAYWEDQLVTTHPIEVEVGDTTMAFANFDGITYGKGASVLKQIYYLLGPKDFEKGIQNYFQKYATKNTELKDFIGSLEQASGKSLNTWVENWLKTPGVNTIETRIGCNGTRLNNLVILQSAPKEYATLREHKTLIGLYRERASTIRLSKSQPTLYSGKETKINFSSSTPCPDYVYPNLQDWDYVQVSLDNNSLRVAKQSLSNIADPMTRLMTWQTLWDMTRSAEIPVTDYLELVQKHLPKENNYQAQDSVITKIGNALTYLIHWEQQSGKTHPLYGETIKFAFNQIGKARNYNLKKTWLTFLIHNIREERDLKAMTNWLRRENVYGVPLDQDLRWAIIYQLSQNGVPGADELIASELKKDPSYRGENSALASTVAKPDITVKRKWWDKIVSENPKESLTELKVAMYNMNPPKQEILYMEFSDKFYDVLPDLHGSRDEEYLESFVRALVPTFCEKKTNKKLSSAIDELDKDSFPAIVIKSLRVALQEDQRCLNIIDKI